MIPTGFAQASKSDRLDAVGRPKYENLAGKGRLRQLRVRFLISCSLEPGAEVCTMVALNYGLM